MSIKLMSQVWDTYHAPAGNAARKLVLLALADAASDEGACWPSIKTIAIKASISPRQVQYHIAALLAEGWIDRMERRTDGRQQSNLWLVRAQPIAPVQPIAPPATHCTGGGAAHCTPGGQPIARGGAMDCGQNHKGTVNEPSGGTDAPPAAGARPSQKEKKMSSAKTWQERTEALLRQHGAAKPDAQEWMERVARMVKSFRPWVKLPTPEEEDGQRWPQAILAAYRAAQQQAPNRSIKWPGDITFAMEELCADRAYQHLELPEWRRAMPTGRVH